MRYTVSPGAVLPAAVVTEQGGILFNQLQSPRYAHGIESELFDESSNTVNVIAVKSRWYQIGRLCSVPIDAGKFEAVIVCIHYPTRLSVQWQGRRRRALLGVSDRRITDWRRR